MILAAAALMITATACNKSEEPATQPQGVSFSLTFEGTTSPKTRVAFEDEALTGKWETEDVVYVLLNSKDGKFYGPFEATPDAAGERASFTAKIKDVPVGTKIDGIDAYHYDNLDEVKFADGAITYSLPASNNGTLSYLTVSSFDYPVGSEPEVIDGGEIDINETLTFTQRLARLDIKTDLSIKEITLSLTDAEFPTSASLNVANVADDNTSATASASMIRINPAVDDYYQIGLVPVSFGSGKTMKATVITTNGEAYTREVTVSAFEKAKRYTLDLSKGSGINPVTPVSTEEALIKMSDSDGDFVLTADITPDNIPHITNFSGTLDGNGHTINISGSESSTTSGQGGIFANTTGDAKISNLDIIGGDRQATMAEGGMLVGLVTNGSTLTIDNVHVEGTITASRDDDASHLFAGGIVGFVPTDSKINISNSSFTGSVTIDQSGTTSIGFKNSYVGGIVGCVETGVSNFSKSSEYTGSTNGSTSTITNCTVTNTNLNNTNGGSYDAPIGDISRSEIYTGGIAGRCTGLITNCSVENIIIRSISEGDGSGRQARPIVGNDWYENSDNADNSYTNVSVNDNEASSGTYNGATKAGGVENRYQTK